jgi:hypothetical protein
MIGYDKTTLKHFELSQLRILIGTQLDKVNKVIVLQLNDQTYQVKIEEMDQLHYPIAGSISYTMDDFQTSLEQGDEDDEEDSVDVGDGVDTDEDRADVAPSVTRTLGGGSSGWENSDLAQDGDKLSTSDDSSLIIFNALHLDVVQDQHVASSLERFPEIMAYNLSFSDSSYIKSSPISNALTVYTGQGTPILREDARNPAAALDLDSLVLAQIASPVYGSGSQSPSDVLSISFGSNNDLALQSTYNPQAIVILEPQHMNHPVILHSDANTKESAIALSAKTRRKLRRTKMITADGSLNETVNTSEMDTEDSTIQRCNRRNLLAHDENNKSSEGDEVCLMLEIGEVLQIEKPHNLDDFTSYINQQRRKEKADWEASQ